MLTQSGRSELIMYIRGSSSLFPRFRILLSFQVHIHSYLSSFTFQEYIRLSEIKQKNAIDTFSINYKRIRKITLHFYIKIIPNKVRREELFPYLVFWATGMTTCLQPLFIENINLNHRALLESTQWPIKNILKQIELTCIFYIFPCQSSWHISICCNLCFIRGKQLRITHHVKV